MNTESTTTPPTKAFVAYYRVSTERQGRSGLGLDAQREMVRTYLSAGGCDLLSEFVEVESGRKTNRPELENALRVCKQRKAILLIAKLDRLARNVHFISGLMESGVEFVAADNPHANRLMVHLLAAFAEHEREVISKRTKEALAAAKARGVVLGVNGRALAERNRQAATAQAEELREVIEAVIDDGHRTLCDIAYQLNKQSVQSPLGKTWYPASVARALRRLHISMTTDRHNERVAA